jgi:hypothetical protein
MELASVPVTNQRPNHVIGPMLPVMFASNSGEEQSDIGFEHPGEHHSNEGDCKREQLRIGQADHETLLVPPQMILHEKDHPLEWSFSGVNS